MMRGQKKKTPDFGDLLKDRRLKIGMTQVQVAERLQVSLPTVIAMEKSARSIKYGTVADYMEFLTSREQAAQ